MCSRVFLDLISVGPDRRLSLRTVQCMHSLYTLELLKLKSHHGPITEWLKFGSLMYDSILKKNHKTLTSLSL